MMKDLSPVNQAHIQGNPLTEHYHRYAKNTHREYGKRDIELKTPDLDLFTEQE